MGEALSSIVTYFKNKASTTLFVVYFCFWAIFHSEGIITLIFTDQSLIYQKYHLLKNEYAFNYFFGVHLNDPLWWVRTFAPFILTPLYICLFPKIVLNPLYKIELRYKYERKSYKLDEERKLLSRAERLDRANEKRVRARTDLIKAEQERVEVSPEEGWKREFEKFSEKKSNLLAIQALEEIYYTNNRCLYDSNGRLHTSMPNIVISESMGLFTRNEKSSSYIDITEKGWYFIRGYHSLNKSSTL